MNAVIEIKIYGKNNHLVTLKKNDEIPNGIYSNKPLKTHLHLTPTITASIGLLVDSITIDNNYSYYLVCNKNLQISNLLPISDFESFTCFLNDSRKYGWTVNRYIDGINNHYGLNYNNKPIPTVPGYTKNSLNLFLFIVLTVISAYVFSLINSETMMTPFIGFMFFTGIAIMVLIIVFGIVRNRSKRKSI